MKQARIYTKALSAHDIASIAGIVSLSPLSVPLVLESHPGQALVLAQEREDRDGDGVLRTRLGSACDAISVMFDLGCIRLSDKPELALTIEGDNQGCFKDFPGSQHGRSLIFTRWHGEGDQRFQINYDGTISAGSQDACKGLVIGMQPEGDEDDYDYEPEGTEKPGTIILVKHVMGSAALKFQIPDVALSCFPVGIPKPSKDVVQSNLISHPGKELSTPNSDFEEIPPIFGLQTRDIDDEPSLRLALDGQSIRPVKDNCNWMDLLAFTTQVYYDTGE